MQARAIFGIAVITVLGFVGSSCSDASRSTGVTGSAIGAVKTLVAVSPTTGIGVAGSSIDDLPAVLAEDANGNPVPNASVRFTAAEAGVVSGGVVVTNAVGIAKPAGWTLGRIVGRNIVLTAAGSIAGPIFTMTAVPGPANAIRKIAGDGQIAASGTAPQVDPTIRVTDVYGNGIAGATASLAVGLGGGNLEKSVVTTDSLGAASVRWTLGERGAQSLLVAVPNLQNVTFTAVAVDISAPCGVTTILPPRTTQRSELSTQSCTTADGRAFETFPVALTAGTYSFKLDSKDFDTELEIRDGDMNLVATNNDASGSGTNSAIKIVAAAGLYTVTARSHVADGRGAFELSYADAGKVSGCEEAYTTRGTITDESIEPNDCVRSDSERENRFRIFVKAGDSLFVRTDYYSYVGPDLWLTDLDGNVVSNSLQDGHYIRKLTFTPTADGFYVIVISGWADEVTPLRMTVK